MWRTLDLGAVVAALPDADAEIVAGHGEMTRHVVRARLAATPDALRHVAPGELIVTTAAAMEGSRESPDRLVARLAAAQIAGVAVRLEAETALPGELLASADRLGIPVITFPDTAGLADVTAAVLDALLDAQRRQTEHVLDIHQRFNRIVLAGGGASEVAATLYHLLGDPVAVLGTDGRPTVVVPSDNEPDLEPGSTWNLRQRIRAGDQDYGEIVVDTRGRPVEGDTLIALDRAAMGIAVRLAQASAVAAEQERFAAVSLEELVSGHTKDLAAVTERAITFGWDLTRPRAVLLASIDPPDDGQTSPSSLATIAAAARATLGPDAIVWTRSSTIAALLAPDTAESAERRRIAEALRGELDTRLRAVSVSIGVGRRVDTPDLLPRSFAEASRAVEVGRWAKGRHVTEVFDDLGLERLLAATPDDYLAEFVHDTIGPLVAHDRAHNSDLVETLAVWLETRNMAEAARRTYVHHNTLKNRLDRIEAIIGPVVGHAVRALECEIAIYIDLHYDIDWRAGREGL